MSDSLDFEQLRKQAKRILKQCHAGDSIAIDRMRAQLPRLAAVTVAEVAARIRLADVQHALARELGCRNWADLKRRDLPLLRFLAAVRGGGIGTAQDELQRFPDLTRLSIHAACAAGDADAVRHHLANDPALATAEEGGWPPLIYACASKYYRLSLRHAFGVYECASLLLDAGADPNTMTLTDPSNPNSKVSAMARAGMNNNRLVLLLLAERGAAPDTRPFQAVATQAGAVQEDPLGKAYRNLYGDPGFLEELKRRLARFMPSKPPNIPQLAQLSIKQIMEFEQEENPTIRDRNIAGLQLAFERGLDPNLRGANGETLLYRFAGRCDSTGLASTELALTHGADPNLAAHDGRTPYSIAVRSGNRRVAALLQAHGAKAESASPADRFIGAVRSVDSEAAKAVLSSHPSIVETVGREARELLERAAKRGQVEAVRLMVAVGFDIAAAGENGATPLHIAAWHGYADIVRMLVGFHAPVNARDAFYRTSPLAWAAHGSRHSKHWQQADEEYCAIVDTLINAGADYASACNPWGVGPNKIASDRVAGLLKARGFGG